MAKQSYGADAALVKGAGALGMSQITNYDFSDITKNAQMWAGYLEKINTKKEAEREKQLASDYAAGKMLDEMAVYNPESTELPKNYEHELTQWMLRQRDEAEILANEVATLEGAEKAEAEIKLGKIKKSMLAATTNAATFDLESRQTLEDFHTGNYSETAIDMGKKDFQISAASGNEQLSIDESGNFYFSHSVPKPVPGRAAEENVQQGGMETKVTKYNVTELFSVDATPRKAGEVASNVMAQVMEAGKKGAAGAYDQFAQDDILIKIGNLTDSMTTEQALSLAGDKFSAQIGGPLAKLSQEELREKAAADPKGFKEEVIRAYQGLAVDMGQKNQDKYNQDLQEAKDKEAARLNKPTQSEKEAKGFVKNFDAGLRNTNRVQLLYNGVFYIKEAGATGFQAYKAKWDGSNYVASESPLENTLFKDANAAGVASGDNANFTLTLP